VLPKTYVETSVISYLKARPSRDEIAAAHQRLTRDWWDHRRARFDVYVSELVVQEASRGDAVSARERLESIAGYPVQRINAPAQELANTIIVLQSVNVLLRDAGIEPPIVCTPEELMEG
jgi:hypothetical protein